MVQVRYCLYTYVDNIFLNTKRFYNHHFILFLNVDINIRHLDLYTKKKKIDIL